jgi:hypothetical protein
VGGKKKLNFWWCFAAALDAGARPWLHRTEVTQWAHCVMDFAARQLGWLCMAVKSGAKVFVFLKKLESASFFWVWAKEKVSREFWRCGFWLMRLVGAS